MRIILFKFPSQFHLVFAVKLKYPHFYSFSFLHTIITDFLVLLQVSRHQNQNYFQVHIFNWQE